VATLIACFFVYRHFALDIDENHPHAVVATVWSGGEPLAQMLLARAGDRDARLDAVLAMHPDSTLVYESIVGEGPVVMWPEVALVMSFVPGRDGLKATLDDRSAYLTPDELLSKQAYDKGLSIPSIQLTTGLDMPIALALLSQRLGTTVSDLGNRGHLRRIRTVRSVPGRPRSPAVTPETMTDGDVRAAAIAAGRYLARGVDAQGRYRYLVDAPTNRTLSGYDWPRHAGATYFLAQIAALSGDPDVAYATLRAASYLRDGAMLRCGAHRCIGDGDRVDVGSTALTVIAFVEIARQKLDRAYALLVPELAAFLRAQQRPDGEFMHEYDRRDNQPVDVQLLYYSGEAALALGRAHTLLGDERDLDAASRALARMTGPGWRFFGSRYYWSEEHWTCQAMADLWERAPNREALDFCLRWHEFGRRLQYGPGDAPFDCDGAYGFGPLVTPRLTPTGSRTEAAVATLEAARRAGVDPAEVERLDQQIRRSLALLLRQQLRPGPTHLFADPSAVDGAVPATQVDWQLRIDYAQHAGCAMVRWIQLPASPSASEGTGTNKNVPASPSASEGTGTNKNDHPAESETAL
jgi:hypothetical protein